MRAAVLWFSLMIPLLGCSGAHGDDETDEETTTTTVVSAGDPNCPPDPNQPCKPQCDVTQDLNGDGCKDAVCKILLRAGSTLGSGTLSKDLLITLKYWGSCENPQDLELNPDCTTLTDTTGDGCPDAVCQLPGGVATYKGQCE